MPCAQWTLSLDSINRNQDRLIFLHGSGIGIVDWGNRQIEQFLMFKKGLIQINTIPYASKMTNIIFTSDGFHYV